MTPRGIRNNNPGNIRWGDAWQGLVAQDQRTDASFCQFTDAKYGIRAMAKIFQKYQDAYKLNTVQGMITRWAPPNENDTTSYVVSVANSVGCKPNVTIDVRAPGIMFSLLKAVIQHENGQQPYSDDQIKAGIALA